MVQAQGGRGSDRKTTFMLKGVDMEEVGEGVVFSASFIKHYPCWHNHISI